MGCAECGSWTCKCPPGDPAVSEKFVGKYMRMAKQVGEDQNPCYSRHIGIVLVRVYPDGDSKVLGTGYNGPPKQTPHCDSREYLEAIVWPQLTTAEKIRSLATVEPAPKEHEQCGAFLRTYSGCGKCPRKVVGAKSGERLELCSCEHGEKNAIVNAGCDLHGAWAFCWCGVACWDCAKLMVNAGIKKAYFIDDGTYGNGNGADYSFGSRWLFAQKGVEIVVRKPEAYLAAGAE